MTEISTFRLNLLRLAYLLMAAGLAITKWPSLLNPATTWELMEGVVMSMLGGMSLMALLGLRYPLQMLPLLFFEITWKALWLTRVALPLWLGGEVDAATAESIKACLLVVVLLPVIPWDYVWKQYVRRPAEPWRAQRNAGIRPDPMAAVQ